MNPLGGMHVYAASLILLLTACSHITPQAVGVVPGEEFSLAVTETAALPEQGLLEFANVVSDSRCPRDVQCVWAGDAVIVLRASDENGSASLTLHTNGPGTARFGIWEVQLVELRPVPREGESLRQADYEVVLRLREVER
ncbi:MAG: hypothetical protein ABR517_13715 [Thermoanaerobaculia bacterium]